MVIGYWLLVIGINGLGVGRTVTYYLIVFYFFCRGASGPDGPDGPDGSNGPDGSDGSEGKAHKPKGSPKEAREA